MFTYEYVMFALGEIEADIYSACIEKKLKLNESYVTDDEQ